jgi:hypothetical protein
MRFHSPPRRTSALVKWLAALTSAFALGGCEAQTTVVTIIEVPSTIAATARSPEQLHVVVTRASSFTRKLDVPGGRCPPFDVTTPPYDGGLTPNARGFELSQSSIPTVPELCVAAWLDTNRNGKIDVGDAVGQLAVPYPAQPSTFLGSNRYASPPVVLETIR